MPVPGNFYSIQMNCPQLTVAGLAGSIGLNRSHMLALHVGTA